MTRQPTNHLRPRIDPPGDDAAPPPSLPRLDARDGKDIARLVAKNRALTDALRFYANEANWVNRSEFKNLPGFHGAATAQRAISGEEPLTAGEQDQLLRRDRDELLVALEDIARAVGNAAQTLRKADAVGRAALREYRDGEDA